MQECDDGLATKRTATDRDVARSRGGDNANVDPMDTISGAASVVFSIFDMLH